MDNKKSLLNDDREKYVFGGLSRIISKAISKKTNKASIKNFSIKDLIKDYEKLNAKEVEQRFNKDITTLKDKDFNMYMINAVNLLPEEKAFVKKQYPDFKGNTAADVYKHTNSEKFVSDMYLNNQREPFTYGGTSKKGMLTDDRDAYDMGGEVGIAVMPIEPTMVDDNEMEEDHTDFILDEALSEEEQDMLMSKLEQDNELQTLFDKVVGVAQEFAGSGSVEGPGTGVSDSIPARLSDGEFVFTAKAVEEIGEDTLMSMMKDAEARVDERQNLNIGGMLVDQRRDVDPLGKPVEEDIVDNEIRKGMLSSNPRLRQR